MSPQQFQQLQTSQLQNLKKIRVEVYLIRHGFSIANRSTFEDEEKWFKSKSRVGLVEKTYEPDPSLTRTGMEQSQDASTKITTVQPDYIFTSVLCRAQQTALFMFPSRQKVIVAPYLKEENNYVDGMLVNSDNKPFEDILTQYEKRHNILSKKDLERLEYSKQVLEGDCTYNEKSRNESGSIKNFIEKFLFPFLIKVPSTKDILKIAIVCHGGLIKRFLNIKHVNNNAVFKVSFTSLLDMQNITIEQRQTATSGLKRIFMPSPRHLRPSFKFEMFFSGYNEFKVSCDPKYVQQIGTEEIVRLKYPSQQILSKRGDYTNQQLKTMFNSVMLQQTTNKPFGSKSSRVQAVIREIKNPQSEDQTILAFKKKHPQLAEQSVNIIKQYFQKNPNDLNKIVLDPKAYQNKLDLIRRSHQLSGTVEAVQLINKQIKNESLHTPTDIFNLINILPSKHK